MGFKNRMAYAKGNKQWEQENSNIIAQETCDRIGPYEGPPGQVREPIDSIAGGVVYSNDIPFAHIDLDITIYGVASPENCKVTVGFDEAYPIERAFRAMTASELHEAGVSEGITVRQGFSCETFDPIERVIIDFPDQQYTQEFNYAIEAGKATRIVVAKTMDALLAASTVQGDRIVIEPAGVPLLFDYASIPGGEGRIEKDYQPDGGAPFYSPSWYLKDHLGSTRMVINAGADGGRLEEATMYQPYGTMVNLVKGPDKNREKFTGKEFDDEGADENGVGGVGMFYFGARYLDADLGLWTSTDPMDEFWDAYSYTGGNPINFIDPFGLEVGEGSMSAGSELTQACQYAQQSPILAAVLNNMVEYGPEYPDWLFGIVANSIMNATYSADWVWYNKWALLEFTGGVALNAVGFAADVGAFGSGFMAIPTGGGTLVLVPAATAVSVSSHTAGTGFMAHAMLSISANQMNQQIKTGNAPSGAKRVDVGKVKGEQTHIHFKNGSALDKDGTWKHGYSKLSKAMRKWLKEAGWTSPRK
jgi:RHS repeat-associated protein